MPYYKRNLRVAGPVMLTQMGAALAGIIDSIMVGHYGTTELAAVSFANSIFFTWMVFAMGAIMGITPLVGYAYVQQKDGEVATLLRAGARFTLLIVAVMVIVLIAFYYIMPHMGQDMDVIRVAAPYYILATISTLPFLLAVLLKQFLEGLGNTMVAMVISLTLNLINIPLNWIFIFGHLGCPALGATGAGVATLIIRILQPILLLLLIAHHRNWGKYLQTVQVSKDKVRELAKIGLPIGLQQMMEIFVFTFSITMVGWISQEAMAAHQIATHVSDLTFMVSLGIGAAATIRVSHQYGEGKLYDMRMAAKASIHLALVWSLIGAALCIGGCRLIPMAFTNDTEVLKIATPILILCGLYQISDALQCVGGAMLRGISDVKIPMFIAFVTYILITLPLGYILMFTLEMGVNGMWIAFIIGLTIAAILLHWRWYKKTACDIIVQ